MYANMFRSMRSQITSWNDCSCTPFWNDSVQRKTIIAYLQRKIPERLIVEETAEDMVNTKGSMTVKVTCFLAYWPDFAPTRFGIRHAPLTPKKNQLRQLRSRVRRDIPGYETSFSVLGWSSKRCGWAQSSCDTKRIQLRQLQCEADFFLASTVSFKL